MRATPRAPFRLDQSSLQGYDRAGFVMFLGADLRLMLVTAALGAALAFIPGCGDDDEEGSEAPFTERASALCTEASEKAVEIEPPGNAVQTAEYAAGMHGVLVELRRGLGDLQPPDELRDSYQNYLDALDEDISTMEGLGAAAESGDQPRIQEIFRTEVDEDAGQIAVNELGLESCGGAANAIAKTP
jgi:hypothetical protein